MGAGDTDMGVNAVWTDGGWSCPSGHVCLRRDMEPHRNICISEAREGKGAGKAGGNLYQHIGSIKGFL